MSSPRGDGEHWRDDAGPQREAWNRFLDALEGLRGGNSAADEMGEHDMVSGTLPAAITARIAAELERARPQPLRLSEGDPDYAYSNLTIEQTEMLNRCHTYLHLAERQLWVIEEALGWLEQPVARSLGAPWRVLNLRAWRTPPGACADGPNDWHSDGFVERFLKMMIFVTPVGPRSGTLELETRAGERRTVSGPAGSWVLFESSRLLHRGIAPEAGEPPRVAIEVTLTPWIRCELRAYSGGLNARYPLYPWMG
jgi:hypothetical protein